jgi:hypothetical protein
MFRHVGSCDLLCCQGLLSIASGFGCIGHQLTDLTHSLMIALGAASGTTQHRAIGFRYDLQKRPSMRACPAFLAKLLMDIADLSDEYA